MGNEVSSASDCTSERRADGRYDIRDRYGNSHEHTGRVDFIGRPLDRDGNLID
jgi:hypothetical protein